MRNEKFLAIDAGTTKLKVALVNEDGSLMDIEDSPVAILYPIDGACEIDMVGLWVKLCLVINSLYERNYQVWNDIIGVGITGQGDGLWPIDKEGVPVRNAMLWNDTRCKNLNIDNLESINEACVKKDTTPLFSGAAPMLLKWIEENEYEYSKKIYKVLHCKDWLNYKLTDKIFTDYTDASTSLMNRYTKNYDEEILDILNLKQAKGLFPTPVPSTTIIGGITKKASMETKLKQGTPVIVGAIDVAATALGVGLKGKEESCTIMGTTICNEIILEKDDISSFDNKGSILCHVIPDKYLRLMATSSGISSLDWVIKTLVPDMDYREIEEKIKNLPIGSDGVIYHPYIYGERAPFKNPFACGGFYGLNVRHNKFNMIRAGYEGLILSIYDCYRYLSDNHKRILVSGGGASSDLLCSILSDCTGKSVIRHSSKELGINGVVNIMKVAFGTVKDFSDLTVDYETYFNPIEENKYIYMNLFNNFENIRRNMESFWVDKSKSIY